MFRKPARELLLVPCLLAVVTALVPHVARAAEHPSIALSDEWTLTVDGQVRPRWSADSGRDWKAGDLVARQYVTQRARLGASVQRGDGWGATVRLQDVRVWGEESSTNDFAARGLDVHEAWVTVPVAAGAVVRVGRQEIALDNHRLVGNADFFQRSRTFDALRVTVQHGAWTVDAWGAWVLAGTANAEPDGHATGLPAGSTATGDVGFAGVHAQWSPTPAHTISAMWLWRGAKPTHEQRHTVGAFAQGTVGTTGLAYTAEAYVQAGHLPSGDILAWLASGKLRYTAPLPGKPSVSAWVDAVSGDGTPGGAFDTLYATNHRYYGEMDVFLDLPKHTGLLGLVDSAVSLAVQPGGSTTVSVDVHLLRAMHHDPKTGSAEFGQEIDAKWTQTWLPGLQTSLLWGLFLPGDALAGIKGLPVATMDPEQLAYLTVDARF